MFGAGGGGFNFGATAPVPTTASTGGFSFGATTAGFSFGANPSAPPPAQTMPAPTSGFSAPSPAQTMPAPTSGFLFGAAPQAAAPTPTVSFGAPPTGGTGAGMSAATSATLAATAPTTSVPATGGLFNFGGTGTSTPGPALTLGVTGTPTPGPALTLGVTGTPTPGPALTLGALSTNVASPAPSTGFTFGSAASSLGSLGSSVGPPNVTVTTPATTISIGVAFGSSAGSSTAATGAGSSINSALGATGQFSGSFASSAAASPAPVATTSTTTGFGLGSGLNLSDLSHPKPAAASTTATTGFSFGALPKTTVPATSGATPALLSFGMASATSTTTTATIATTTGTTSATTASTDSQMNYRQLEDAINKWTVELEDQEKIFLQQATQVNAWDRLLIENGEKITNLNNDVERVKLDQQRLDHELDFIRAQHRELDELLLPLEASVEQLPAINYQQHADLEREHTYQLAENIDAQLKRMVQDLKEIIDHVNSTNSNQDNNDPIYQITKILNAHMDSLQWIDQNTVLLNRKVEDISRQMDSQRKEQERNFRLAYD